jgi:hypothetical protein
MKKVMYIDININKKCVGLHFAPLFLKLIWSPWSAPFHIVARLPLSAFRECFILPIGSLYDYDH